MSYRITTNGSRPCVPLPAFRALSARNALSREAHPYRLRSPSIEWDDAGGHRSGDLVLVGHGRGHRDECRPRGRTLRWQCRYYCQLPRHQRKNVHHRCRFHLLTLNGTITDGTSGGILTNILIQITTGSNAGEQRTPTVAGTIRSAHPRPVRSRSQHRLLATKW